MYDNLQNSAKYLPVKSTSLNITKSKAVHLNEVILNGPGVLKNSSNPETSWSVYARAGGPILMLHAGNWRGNNNSSGFRVPGSGFQVPGSLPKSYYPV